MDLKALNVDSWSLSICGAEMTNMRAMIVPAAGAKLQLEERNLPEPARREVRLRVHACGVCHSDVLTVEGSLASEQSTTRGGSRVTDARSPPCR